ncbi:MAG TPA: ABC transporter permease subunit/CPBP intramembrane protease [Polyangia bacterium]|nr:ABC transporter permease subunit/CPBP intramembrane protease [Polyangia bacterium]
MKLADVLLVAGKELRETLRDRRTLAVMVLFPLVVYPLITLATLQVMSVRLARTEKQKPRVAISGPSALADKLRARLAARNHGAGDDFALSSGPVTAADIRAGKLDAAIAVDAPTRATDPPSAHILFDPTQERSRTARARVEDALAPASDPGCAAPYSVSVEGVAPQQAMGGYALSKVLPLVIVIMVMLGAFHPAIDITAGERERGTLETTLSAPIARAALMTGKVVAVATLAALSGVLNLASMSITVLEGTRLATSGTGMTFSLPLVQAGAAALLVIPPAAFLFASVMVAIGALARSFKEAQTLLTPVYFLGMAPSLLAAVGDFELTPGVAFIPGIGVTLLARDVISGHAALVPTLAVFASSVAYGAVALAVACRLYDSERLIGADAVGLGLRDWLRHLAFGPRMEPADINNTPPTAGHAIALFGIGVVLLVAFVPIQVWNLAIGLALFEWVGLLGLTAVYARGSGRRLASVLRLSKPSAASVVGAVLIGSSAWLVIGLLVEWVLPPPKEMVEHLRRVITPAAGGGAGAFLLALLLTAVSPAICEEALFRGPILRGLRTRFSATGSAILTGLLFGLFHGDVWRFIPATMLGFALSVIALAADSIVPAMLAHFANNACIIGLVSMGVSDEAAMAPKLRLTLVAIGTVGIAAGTVLLAHAYRARKRQMTL